VARQPDGPPPPPVVQRVRLRYAKRGRLRFTSHRDIARAVERALQRARVPMAYSAGFNPHPKISWLGASPTGVASEAEYVELALAERVEPAVLRGELDTALPPGIDVLEVVEATAGSLAERIEASSWRIELPGVRPEELAAALATFLAAPEVPVERLTKNGRRTMDARDPVVHAVATESGIGALETECAESYAILDVVVRHVTPAVRPDDVLTGMRVVADLVPPVPPRATRLAQGALSAEGRLTDPLAADRDRTVTGVPSSTTVPT
jgi:radical SAM-linked protein